LIATLAKPHQVYSSEKLDSAKSFDMWLNMCVVFGFQLLPL